MLAWGISWPSTKIALSDISPMWFTALRLLGGSVLMFVILSSTKSLRLPKREDLPMIFIMGLVQMALIILLVNCALQFLNAGSSALLVDSAVIWVAPVAILFFGERMTRLKWIGMVLGCVGILMLIGPWQENWSDPEIVVGYLLLGLATLIWAGIILYMRYGKWHSSPMELLPWQFLVGAIPVMFLAFLYEPLNNIHFTASALTQLGFCIVFATVFGYWGIQTATKQLPSITSALMLLGIPLVAVLSSYFMLHEVLTLSTCVAMVLLLGGIYAAKN